MPEGDVKIGISTTYDGKADAKAAEGLKRIDDSVKKVGRSAAEASPKISKYSQEVRAAGVSASEMARATTAGPDGGVPGIFSKIALRATLVVGAVLGVRKVFQAIGNAPEVKAFRSDMAAAATAMGSLIARSGPVAAVLNPLGKSFRAFAESVNPEKLDLGVWLGVWVEKIKEIPEAAGSAAEKVGQLSNALEHLSELSAARKDSDPKLLREKLVGDAAFIEAGGFGGFDEAPDEADLVARAERANDLRNQEAEIRNELRRHQEFLANNQKLRPAEATLAQERSQGLLEELRRVSGERANALRDLPPGVTDAASASKFAREAGAAEAAQRIEANRRAMEIRARVAALDLQPAPAVVPGSIRQMSDVRAEFQAAAQAQQPARNLASQQAAAAVNSGIYMVSKELAAAATELAKVAPALTAILQSIKTNR
jgi:hypothetical protein